MTNIMQPGDYVLAEDIDSEETLDQIREAVRAMGWNPNQEYGQWSSPMRSNTLQLSLDKDGDLGWGGSLVPAIEHIGNRWVPAEFKPWLRHSKFRCTHPEVDMMTEHEHEQQLRERLAECIREGRDPAEEFQFWDDEVSWKAPVDGNNVLKWVRMTPNLVRLKPRTITIAGMEVPEPMREPLKDGDTYYAPGVYGVATLTWMDTSFDWKYLLRSFAHHTYEAALTHQRALVLVSGGDPDA